MVFKGKSWCSWLHIKSDETNVLPSTKKMVSLWQEFKIKLNWEMNKTHHEKQAESDKLMFLGVKDGFMAKIYIFREKLFVTTLLSYCLLFLL